MSNQGNGAGQEPGAGNQGQGQEPASQQGQSGDQGAAGQEPGGNGDQGNLTDLTNMTPEQLRTYAATVQKDAVDARREAASYRTQFQDAQGKLTEAERAKMDELDRVKLEAQEAKDALTQAQAQMAELTVGRAVREALAGAQALNPATAAKVLDSSLIVLDDGKPTEASVKAAISALKTSDPYLFKRGASANAGAGRGPGASPQGGGSAINDMIRGRR